MIFLRAVRIAALLDGIDDRIELGPRDAYKPLLDLARPWITPVPLVAVQGDTGDRSFPSPATPKPPSAVRCVLAGLCSMPRLAGWHHCPQADQWHHLPGRDSAAAGSVRGTRFWQVRVVGRLLRRPGVSRGIMMSC